LAVGSSMNVTRDTCCVSTRGGVYGMPHIPSALTATCRVPSTDLAAFLTPHIPPLGDTPRHVSAELGFGARGGIEPIFLPYGTHQLP
jgi:hypothetical protein